VKVKGWRADRDIVVFRPGSVHTRGSWVGGDHMPYKLHHRTGNLTKHLPVGSYDCAMLALR
jgi:hypothetical protein